MGKPVPVVITVYKDKFDFVTKSICLAFYKRSSKIKKWLEGTWKSCCGSITSKQAEAIAKEK